MTESVEWERLADHEEAPGDRAEPTRRPLCDRISYVADQLEASITGLRGLVGVSRTRVVLAASVVTLREVADLVLDQGVELDDLRQQLQSATVLPERWRDVLAERDAARRELAEVRERIERVRHHAQHPRASSGLIRDYVYARGILALLGDEKAVDDV